MPYSSETEVVDFLIDLHHRMYDLNKNVQQISSISEPIPEQITEPIQRGQKRNSGRMQTDGKTQQCNQFCQFKSFEIQLQSTIKNWNSTFYAH